MCYVDLQYAEGVSLTWKKTRIQLNGVHVALGRVELNRTLLVCEHANVVM